MKNKLMIIGLSVMVTLAMVSFTTTESISNTNQTNSEGMNFTEGTFAEILAKAKKEKKNIFFDAYASWCGPCRNENPNVVAAYQKFKDKNFTVLGVSLDEGKEEWLQAVKDDGLAWTQISDLKKWESTVVGQYKFDGIPFNVLIDPSGKIIASSLRGADLEKKLTELLIKK